MFVFSVKTSRKRIWTAVLCVGVLLVLLLLALRPAETSAGATVKAADNTTRVALLAALGYEVDPAGEVREVLIPDEFDATFSAYNALQQQVGMDLEPYHGKRVKCWTYTVKNVPADSPTVVHIYLYKDTVIGGDVTPLKNPTQIAPLIPRETL